MYFYIWMNNIPVLLVLNMEQNYMSFCPAT